MSSLPSVGINESTAELPMEANPAWAATETLAPPPPAFRENATASLPSPESPASAEAPFPTSGSLLRGRYLLGEILGRGGAAIVYRAQDLGALDATGKPCEVAVKLLRPDRYQRTIVIERLKKEFQLAHTISHPNSVRIYDLDRHDSDGREIWFMTLELLAGQNLATLMASSTTRLSMPRIRKIVLACGNILTFAHERNVTHGDFKPGNVFVTRNDEVRVLDFGSAQHAADATTDVQRAATFCYASPEVLMGMQPTPADDVFSLACVAYELVNARHPYDRRSTLEALTAKLRPARPPTLGERQWLALQAALSFNRDRRPPMKTLLREFLSTEKSPAAIPLVERPMAVPLMERPTAIPHVERPVAAPRVTEIIRPDWEAIQRKFADRAGPRRPFVATLFSLLGVALLIAGWQLFGPLRIPAGTELRSNINAVLLSAKEKLQDMRLPARRARPKNGALIQAEQTAPIGETSLPPVASATPAAPAVDDPKPAVPTSEPAAPPVTRQTISPANRGSGVSSYIAFADPDIRVGEQTSTAAIGVKRSYSLTGNSSIRWRTVSGTARADADFVAAEGSIYFPEGLDFRILYVTLINDDQPEGDEQFRVELYDPSARTLIGPLAETQVTITDDD